MPYSIAQVNQMDEAEFVDLFGPVFEHTPAIARQVWQQRPFDNVMALYQRMEAIVFLMNLDEQLALIRAHPDLGGRVAMADASVKEQLGAGLDRLTPDECDRLQLLNQRYKERFGFPFIVAVKNHTKGSILDAFERRLTNPIDLEMAQALTEIVQIAKFRLHALVT
jgi:2-oxo-4-hydroxy-4-carboxy-5-ureidoimidazoline decarboxylase